MVTHLPACMPHEIAMPCFRKSIHLSKYGLYFPPGSTETGFPYLSVNCFSVSPSRANAVPASPTIKMNIQSLISLLRTSFAGRLYAISGASTRFREVKRGKELKRRISRTQELKKAHE